jgi:hypothetical protein
MTICENFHVFQRDLHKFEVVDTRVWFDRVSLIKTVCADFRTGPWIIACVNSHQSRIG